MPFTGGISHYVTKAMLHTDGTHDSVTGAVIIYQPKSIPHNLYRYIAPPAPSWLATNTVFTVVYHPLYGRTPRAVRPLSTCPTTVLHVANDTHSTEYAL